MFLFSLCADHRLDVNFVLSLSNDRAEENVRILMTSEANIKKEQKVRFNIISAVAYSYSNSVSF